MGNVWQYREQRAEALFRKPVPGKGEVDMSETRAVESVRKGEVILRRYHGAWRKLLVVGTQTAGEGAIALYVERPDGGPQFAIGPFLRGYEVRISTEGRESE